MGVGTGSKNKTPCLVETHSLSAGRACGIFVPCPVPAGPKYFRFLVDERPRVSQDYGGFLRETPGYLYII